MFALDKSNSNTAVIKIVDEVKVIPDKEARIRMSPHWRASVTINVALSNCRKDGINLLLRFINGEVNFSIDCEIGFLKSAPKSGSQNLRICNKIIKLPSV